MAAFSRVALIGFGEVGRTLGADLLVRGATVSAYDILFARAESAPSKALAEIPARQLAEDAPIYEREARPKKATEITEDTEKTDREERDPQPALDWRIALLLLLAFSVISVSSVVSPFPAPPTYPNR